MIAVPAETPITTPDTVPTFAIAILLLLHVPPPGAPTSVVDPPWHTAIAPLIDGNGLTENDIIAMQPGADV